jgi:ribonucleotide reductase beta subunit family protein with ferritin-like domain
MILNQLKSHTNFFESRVTDYQKNIEEGSDDDDF